jgi:lysophospholipase L1-like esterase
VAEARVKFAPSLDIFFSGKVFNGVVTPDDLAIECFHPNARAQEQLSKALWSEIPWFR